MCSLTPQITPLSLPPPPPLSSLGSWPLSISDGLLQILYATLAKPTTLFPQRAGLRAPFWLWLLTTRLIPFTSPNNLILKRRLGEMKMFALGAQRVNGSGGVELRLISSPKKCFSATSFPPPLSPCVTEESSISEAGYLGPGLGGRCCPGRQLS